MASKVTKVITVSINSEEIKMCELDNSKKNVSVLWATSVPTPSNSYDDGEIVDVEKVSRAIKQTIYRNRVNAKHIIFTVQGSKLANKEIVIPAIKKDKIKNMIDANCSEYFPIDTEQFVFAHTVLEQFTDEDKSKKMRLMIIAAPETVIDSYYVLAERLELKLESIDYIGNSILQTLKHQVDEKPNFIIQINDSTTVVNIVRNGVLQLQRTVPYGMNVLVNAVMEEKGVDEARALELLKTEKLIHSSYDGDHITDSLRYMLGNLTRIADYYSGRNQDAPLEKAYVITNGEEILGLSALFTAELNLTTEVLIELKNVVGSKKYELPKNHLMDYIENLGALLQPVDLRSKRYTAKVIKKEGRHNSVVLLVGAVFIAAVLVAYPYWNYSMAVEHRDHLNSQIEEIKDVEDIVNRYYDAKDKLTDMTTFVALTYSDNDSILYMFNKLEEILPSDIFIESFGVSGATVTLTATGNSKLCVAKFLEELGKLENVYDISIAGVTETKTEEGDITEKFSLSFRYTMVEEPEDETEEESAEEEESVKEAQ